MKAMELVERSQMFSKSWEQLGDGSEDIQDFINWCVKNRAKIVYITDELDEEKFYICFKIDGNVFSTASWNWIHAWWFQTGWTANKNFKKEIKPSIHRSGSDNELLIDVGDKRGEVVPVDYLSYWLDGYWARRDNFILKKRKK